MKNGVIIDEEAVSRTRLRKILLKAYPGITLSEFSDSHNACEAIEKQQFGIALMDVGLRNRRGENLISLINQSSPDTPIIVCTSFDDDSHLFDALHAGAYGYLLKDTSEEIFIHKLQGIVNGDPPLSPGITRKLLRHYQSNGSQSNSEKQHQLSPRESEVLIYIAKGMSRKEISRLLNLADSTVAGYIRDIYRSLNISCRAEAAIQACKMGLIDPEKFH